MAVKILLLYCMIFCHIVDDYYLQGVLAKMKQRKWWNENAPQMMYKYDYVVALIMHGFSWSFMIHLPIVVYGIATSNYDMILSAVIFLPVQALAHAYIDNEKANEMSINLISDQILHLMQIVFVWLITIGVFKI